MNRYGRRHTLLGLLKKQPGLSVSQLAASLEVSEGTVRNDLNALEAEGQLTRIHGGAILNAETEFINSSFSARHQEHSIEKSLIARSAADLVNDGDSILLDASSTVFYFANVIKNCQLLRVVTNGLDVARLLSKNPTNMVILIGGELSLDGSSVTGLLSEEIIQELHIQKAFVSCSGFSLERGMTEVHLGEAQLKRKAIESASELYALVDSSKFGKEDLTSFARIDQIIHLFTDSGLSPQWASQLNQANINFTICQEDLVTTR